MPGSTGMPLRARPPLTAGEFAGHGLLQMEARGTKGAAMTPIDRRRAMPYQEAIRVLLVRSEAEDLLSQRTRAG